MNKATRSFSNRVAVVFDFDETLTPEDSFATLLRHLEIDAEQFKCDRVQPLVDQGWEKYLARAYCLVKESQQRDKKITKETLADVGKEIKLYDGTQELFNRLQTNIKSINKNIELEFYLISGGFADIARNTSIAKDFKCMWGCEFKYNKNNEIEFMKRQMTHVAKTRYLYYLSKGINQQNEKDLIYKYDAISPEDLHVPLTQVIYVGDGASDVPCFAVMKDYSGVAIGIYKPDASPEEWKYLESVNRSQRLSSLVPAGYAERSELMRSLTLSVEFMAKRISLRQASTPT